MCAERSYHVERRDPCLNCQLPECRENSPDCKWKKANPLWHQTPQGRARLKVYNKELWKKQKEAKAFGSIADINYSREED